MRRFLRRLILWLLIVVVALPLAYLAVFRFVPIPGTPLMVLRAIDGEDWRREWRSIDTMSPHLLRAVIASEDARFCQHGGFDLNQIEAAVADYAEGGRLRGASTISMQTAKNLFLWPGRSFLRKGLEAWLTLLVEATWSKRRIMEAYLNVVEFGPGIYGAEAAAQAHFGRSAAQLTSRQAALLAAVLPNPRLYSAARPSTYIRRRAAIIGARAQAVPLAKGGICP